MTAALILWTLFIAIVSFLFGRAVNSRTMKESELPFEEYIGYLDDQCKLRISVQADTQDAAKDMASKLKPIILEKLAGEQKKK